ncbi:hypothetical protein Tco_0647387 [Tanacetum coccineum]
MDGSSRIDNPGGHTVCVQVEDKVGGAGLLLLLLFIIIIPISRVVSGSSSGSASGMYYLARICKSGVVGTSGPQGGMLSVDGGIHKSQLCYDMVSGIIGGPSNPGEPMSDRSSDTDV